MAPSSLHISKHLGVRPTGDRDAAGGLLVKMSTKLYSNYTRVRYYSTVRSTVTVLLLYMKRGNMQ